MQHLVVSTEAVSEAQRFSYWRSAVGEIVVPGDRDRPPDTPFEGRLLATVGGSLARFRFRSSKYRVCRHSCGGMQRSGDDRIWLYREIGEGSWHEHHGREFLTRSGDLIIGNPALPATTESVGNYDHEIWHFPRSLLERHLPAARYSRLLLVSDRKGVNGILASYIEALSSQVDALDDRQAEMVADNFCRLVAIACGSHPTEHEEAFVTARLQQVKRYILLHLSDPELRPATVAAALKMSVRQVHLLFEPTGTSFGQFVLRQRLDECRAALSVADGDRRSVTDIAFAWGFNSLSTFYRTFRAAYGVSPGEWREAGSRPM